ncbi:MAG: serine/threonine protein kinase, partial [Myxococcales bacterium]|nr:serine/threonine protein kinase [Myxococcales bacterium]
MESDEAWLTSTVADGGGQGGAVDGSGGRRLTAMSEEDSVEDLELFGAVADKLFGRTDREVASPQPPTIGRFVVLRRLGAGGMGVVYLAHDPALDRQVAIKRLHPRALSGEGIDAAAERLRREARAMARVSHRNVVNLYEVGAHKGQLYLAMEYVRGATLTSWLSQRARGWREILAVYCDAGEGLSAAHSAGLVHRDFKPDNVLVSAAGDVKVTDFGLVVAAKDRPASAASSASGRVEAGDSLSATLTSTGAWLGTPRYMSPEQFRGDVTDPRSDQFSFCVALYEALYGERPFAGATVDALAKAVVAGRRRPLPRGAATPTWIAPLLARGLATDPGERWPTMAALLARLRDDPRPRRRRRVSLGAAAIAVLGASGSLVAQRLAKRQAAAACERAGAELDDVWSDDARAAFTHAIERSGTRFARSTAARTLPWIDAYVEQWGQARVDACFAAEVDGTWEEALREGSYACLDERRAQLVHLLNTLEA